MRRTRSLILVSALALVAACAARQRAPSPSGTPAGGSDAPSAGAPPARPFDELSREEQVRHMKEVVAPRMAQLFRGHDPEHFKEFGCASCHGEGAKRGSFEMPNPELPELDPKDHFAEHRAEEPAMLDFMLNTVAPEMARLLGEPAFDPATGKGFGCADCHRMVGQ